MLPSGTVYSPPRSRETPGFTRSVLLLLVHFTGKLSDVAYQITYRLIFIIPGTWLFKHSVIWANTGVYWHSCRTNLFYPVYIDVSKYLSKILAFFDLVFFSRDCKWSKYKPDSVLNLQKMMLLDRGVTWVPQRRDNRSEIYWVNLSWFPSIEDVEDR